MITLIANSLSIEILLGYFLARLMVHIYVFYGLKDIFLQSSANFFGLILLLYVFNIQQQYSITI